MPNTALVTAGSVLTATEFNYLPRGLVVKAEQTTNQTGIGSTFTDTTSLTVTWTATSSRLYRISAYLPLLSQVTAAGYIQAQITNPSNTQLVRSTNTLDAGRDTSLFMFVVETGLSGSTTRKVRIATQGGTVSFTNSATSFSTLLVEDIGAA